MPPWSGGAWVQLGEDRATLRRSCRLHSKSPLKWYVPGELMTSEDLGEQDRAFLARVGAVPTDRKPVRSGAAAGRATSILLMLVLGWRLGFGDPAKRYFTNAP